MQDGRVYMRQHGRTVVVNNRSNSVSCTNQHVATRGAGPVPVRTRLVPLRTALGREARPSADAQRKSTQAARRVFTVVSRPMYPSRTSEHQTETSRHSTCRAVGSVAAHEPGTLDSVVAKSAASFQTSSNMTSQTRPAGSESALLLVSKPAALRG